jgi:hypothetical protein
MRKGGKRPGAGRPKGARNKRTVETAKAIEASGMSPLDYMISLMRDETREVALRLDAAKSAAPYVHSRLASQELTIRNPDDEKTEEELLAELEEAFQSNPALVARLKKAQVTAGGSQ